MASCRSHDPVGIPFVTVLATPAGRCGMLFRGGARQPGLNFFAGPLGDGFFGESSIPVVMSKEKTVVLALKIRNVK